MTDYISREALKAAFEEDGHLSAYIEEMNDAIPAADVVEVKRGRWLEREDKYYGWNVWECTACHEEFVLDEGTPVENEYHFCPNCGAKMEEEQR